MKLDFFFFFSCISMGVALAMDAFSVSLANGLNEPGMRTRKMCAVAGIFGIFQGLMPLLGWLCFHFLVQYFGFMEKLIPWVALALLGFIGGKMLYDGIAGEEEENCACGLGFGSLLVQGIATSIDAFSVGSTISDYNFLAAVLAAAMIAVVTFEICLTGIFIGKKSGTKLAGKACILGGVILIAIGLLIWIKSFL
ncbi:MAG: manganese efflux pump [Ruminococcaceae bacterium]|nr:manganese efflux pump [Oscillospiraceae bacterium]